MPFAVAVPLPPVNSMWGVLNVPMVNGDLYPVVTAVALNVRTMKPANGLTGSRVNYCLFLTS
ncbi:hypothetical protein JCM12294_49130 [Desulfocicer niacini]